MKQFASIFLLLLMLKLSAIGQSRILTGTLTSKLNTSTTILPHIVQTKTPEAQKEDSALYNPRYVPPPPVDSSVYNANTVNNNQGQNRGTIESTYQYKTPDAQPVLDGSNGNKTLTPPLKFNSSQQNVTPTSTVESSTYQYKTPDAQPVLDGSNGNKTLTPPLKFHSSQQNVTPTSTVESSTYQYKTPDAQPVLDGNTTKAYTPVWHPKKKRTAVYNSKYGSVQKDYNQAATAIVSDPNELAAAENYGNTTAVPKTPVAVNTYKYSKWKPVKKVQSTSTPTVQLQTYTPPAQQPNYSSATTITPAVRMRRNSNPTVVKNYTPAVSDNTIQPQPQQADNVNVANKSDYKVNLTTDGKYTVTFFNNGSSINVTQFGRISGVTSPVNGTNTTSQYDYRGMLQSVGSLPLQYTYEGRLQSVGNTTLGYNYNGNIESIGGTPLSYNYNGTIDRIGNTKVLYDANNNVSSTSNNNPTIVLKTN